MNNICFNNIEVFTSIAEYDFYLVNVEGVTNNNLKYELFFKVVKKGKIKESLFCIGDLAYEKYFSNFNSKEDLNKNKKITILEERECIKDINKVSINLFENSMKKENFNIEINFIKISSIIEKYKKNKWKGWEEIFELNHEDILLIGKKNNI